MSLTNLLQAATGIVGRGAFFQWCLNVSNSLSGSGSGAVYPQYAYAKSSAAQAGVTADTTLELETDGLTNGISRDPGTGDSWVLTAGKVYALSFGGFFDTFSDATGGQLSITWVDDNNVALVSGSAQCPAMIFSPGTNTTARCTASSLTFVYQPPAVDIQRVVKIRCTAATGTANKPNSSWWASIIEIPVAA